MYIALNSRTHRECGFFFAFSKHETRNEIYVFDDRYIIAKLTLRHISENIRTMYSAEKNAANPASF